LPAQETKKVLIVVRTYPTPAKKGVEVSCTAAITDAGQWIRLFPIPYRFLDREKRFKKYEWVEVEVTKATSDARPESYKLVSPDAIKILSGPLPTTNNWKARKDAVFPLKAHCLCCLQKYQQEHGAPTLGIFQPKKIDSLVISPDTATWNPAQLAILRQGDLFKEAPQSELEKIPFKFQYKFHCDEPACLNGNGHTIVCTDWEMGASWRKWRQDYGDSGWEEKFRQKYETEMIEKLDTHFYVGTIHKHPKIWIIVGLFYPPKPTASPEQQPRLF
jgi:hypothetical protein